MASWQRFNETSLPPKESFYNELNLEGITDEKSMRCIWTRKLRRLSRLIRSVRHVTTCKCI